MALMRCSTVDWLVIENINFYVTELQFVTMHVVALPSFAYCCVSPPQGYESKHKSFPPPLARCLLVPKYNCIGGEVSSASILECQRISRHHQPRHLGRHWQGCTVHRSRCRCHHRYLVALITTHVIHVAMQHHKWQMSDPRIKLYEPIFQVEVVSPTPLTLAAKRTFCYSNLISFP